MALFTSYLDAPKVYSSSAKRYEYARIYGAIYRRLVEESQYEYTCLSEAAAKAGTALINSATATATAERANGPMWCIKVAETTTSAWAEVE